MQNTLKHKPPSHYMSKPKKANFFVKTLRNIDPASSSDSSTFTFETQAVFLPCRSRDYNFRSAGKDDSENREWRECWDKNRFKGQKILFIQFYLDYPLKMVNRKVQQEPQAEAAGNPRHQEEEKNWYRLMCA